MRFEVVDWGLIDYEEALAKQRTLFEKLIIERDSVGWLIFCQHPHVYTVGKSGRMENLLVNEGWLRRQGAKVCRVDRGGDITYHGPGQLVVYPILDLDKLGLGLREYIEVLEQCVIDLLADRGIRGERVPKKTGVWVKGAKVGANEEYKKICAIGVRASRGCVMHGLALNVTTDLRWFSYINPCGMTAGVTSIENENKNI